MGEERLVRYIRMVRLGRDVGLKKYVNRDEENGRW